MEFIIALVVFAALSIAIEAIGGFEEPAKPFIAANADNYVLATFLP